MSVESNSGLLLSGALAFSRNEWFNSFLCTKFRVNVLSRLQLYDVAEVIKHISTLLCAVPNLGFKVAWMVNEKHVYIVIGFGKISQYQWDAHFCSFAENYCWSYDIRFLWWVRHRKLREQETTPVQMVWIICINGNFYGTEEYLQICEGMLRPTHLISFWPRGW